MNKQEQFLNEIKQKFSNEKDNIIILNYNGNYQPIKIKCSRCNTIQELKQARTLLNRQSDVFCKTCYNPLESRKQQYNYSEKAKKLFEKTPHLHLLELYQKQRGERRRLCVRYYCEHCGKISEIYFCDLKNEHYTCKHCEAIRNLNKNNFPIWLDINYPELEILDLNEINKSTSRIHVKCKNCGFIFYPSITTLKRKKKAICPKCRNGKSRPELYISEWLIKNNILFSSEVVFDWLPNARYDFLIPEYNLIIEYDGEQHDKYVPHFHSSKEDFIKKQEKDKIKTQKALENNYTFLRISYKYNNKIKEILSNLFSSTTISQESRGKYLETATLLSGDDIV